MRYVQEKAKDERPFFIYWATYTQQLQGPLSALSLVQFYFVKCRPKAS